MRMHLAYLKAVLRHKWFVFWACMSISPVKLFWRAIIHDWTKFTPAEWTPYVLYFNGPKTPHPKGTHTYVDGSMVPLMVVPDDVQKAFDLAWNHHQKLNSHHWQWYQLMPDNPRPSFAIWSHDGGDTEATVTHIESGHDTALVYDDTNATVSWLGGETKEERSLHAKYHKLLAIDLNHVPIPLEMSELDRMEMLADWIGAGKAYGNPNTWEWYDRNKENISLHPQTREWIELELEKLKQHDAFVRKMKGMGF